MLLLILCVVAAALGGLATALRPNWPVLGLALLAVPVGAVAEGVSSGRLERAVVGLVAGTAVAACACLGALTVRAVRARRAYVERGWAFARAEARERDVRVREAVLRERQRMAGEVHDGLGHRLTLLAVQAGRLSLDDSLPEPVRRELSGIREGAANASLELGQTVQLLDRGVGLPDRDAAGTGRPPTVPTAPVRPSIAAVADEARESGTDVQTLFETGVEQRLGDFTHAAVIRTMQEGLVNAAKHAPGATVHLSLAEGPDHNTVTLELVNPVLSSAPPEPLPGTGYGLRALEHRAQILGGSLTPTGTGEEFRLVLALPVDAVPGNEPKTGNQEAAVIRQHQASRQTRSSAVTLLYTVPAVLAAVAAIVGGGYFIYATSASVLPPQMFAKVEVGASQPETAELLPALDMLEAPRSEQDAADGECHYYESSRSFFERDDVYRICFDQGVVSAVSTIAAP
ncbi:sensor histidine kinase [Kineosporia babensis]|uniref:histidine kinase n=1 Tax=Kineosporia babensis TaxID=499548 RepID=A0A9X1NHP2_9ACTN|nr:histidine kinase [Kineosporia babensis]MCD5314333.1 histidine kinase [Kineosporia babensis]